MTVRVVPEFGPNTGNFRRDRPGAMGGGCTLCRSRRLPEHPGVVELGPNAQPFREGMVVLCFQCAGEIGAVIGMISPVKAVELAAERDAALERAATAEADAETLHALANAVAAAAAVVNSPKPAKAPKVPVPA